MTAILFGATLLVLLAWLFGPPIKPLSINCGLSLPLMMLMIAARFMAAHFGMSGNAFDDHDRPLASVLLSNGFAAAFAAVAVFVAAVSLVWSFRKTR